MCVWQADVAGSGYGRSRMISRVLLRFLCGMYSCSRAHQFPIVLLQIRHPLTIREGALCNPHTIFLCCALPGARLVRGCSLPFTQLSLCALPIRDPACASMLRAIYNTIAVRGRGSYPAPVYAPRGSRPSSV